MNHQDNRKVGFWGRWGIGRLLTIIIVQQEQIMADISALQAELEDVKLSAQDASNAVLVEVSGLKDNIVALQEQIAELVAGQVSQEQIDELLATAQEADATVDAITAAATPAPEPGPIAG